MVRLQPKNKRFLIRLLNNIHTQTHTCTHTIHFRILQTMYRKQRWIPSKPEDRKFRLLLRS